MQFHVNRQNQYDYDGNGVEIEEDDPANLIGEVLMDNFGPLFEIADNISDDDDALQAAGDDNILVRFIMLLRRNQNRIFDPNQIERLVAEVNDMSSTSNQPKLSKDQISMLKVKLFDKNPTVKECEEERCSVCLQAFTDKEQVKQLPCNHLYHPLCIDAWLCRNTYCPVCKQDTAKALEKLHQQSA